MSKPINLLELRSVRGTGGGPEKTILLGAAHSSRVRVTVCYIRDVRDERFEIDARAAAAGVDYVEIRERHSFDPSIWPALRRLIRERRIDIIHAHEHKTDLLALMLARVEKILPLATAHGWSGLSFRERLYYFFDRRLLARYPIVIAVSTPVRSTIVGHGANPERVRLVPNGIDHEYFTRTRSAAVARAGLAIPHNALIVGAVGRLEPVKRFDLLLDAVARLQLLRPVHVVIAGVGSCRASLESRATALGFRERLHLLGYRDDARDVHQMFDIYVQTSDSEGSPNAILEAMALETPVVATAVGGTPEVIDDSIHGLLVPPGDARALATAIEQTIVDVDETARRISAARTRIEREFSFTTRMTAVEQIYEELMEMGSIVKRQQAAGWA